MMNVVFEEYGALLSTKNIQMNGLSEEYSPKFKLFKKLIHKFFF